ncbi:MAG: hypothetical protein ABJA82_01045, partial [Myxococcales bacterium]
MLGLNSRRLGLSFMLLGAVAVAGCGSDGATTKPDSGADKPADMRGSGGQVGTGGQFGTGGQLGTGGSLGTGGALDTGGAPGTGGTAGTGGAIGTGGNVATGGTTTGGAGGSPSGGAGGTRTGGAGGTGGMGTGGMGTGGAGGAGTSCTSAATCPAPAGGNGMAVCNGSICGVVCNNGYHRCGNVCALNNSPLTCGTTAAAAACTPCAVPTNGTATCDGTPLACGVNCTTGYHACGSACIVNG